MEGPEVYKMMALLFSFPFLLLVAAWWYAGRSVLESAEPVWRRSCTVIALILGSLTLADSVAFFVSWFNGGGSPHGMDPAPGLWVRLGPITWKFMVATILAAAFSIKRARWLLLGLAPSIFVTSILVFYVERLLED
jgi:hypothetical protein